MKRRTWLIAITGFNAVTAVAGAVQLTSGWYAPPDSWLSATPFSSYVIPGLILGIAVGGSAALAAILLLSKHWAAPLATLGSGIIMIGWICGEIAMVQHFSWLQVVYCVLGGLLVGLTYTDSKRFFLGNQPSRTTSDSQHPIYH